MTSAARTTQDASSGEAAPGDTPGKPRSRWHRLISFVRANRLDLVICLLFMLIAGWSTNGLWPDPNGRFLALNPEDQVLYEWFLASDARVLHGDFSLLSDRLNVPDGVNLMANTTVIALGVLFAPVTLLAGAPVTFALLAGLNLALTAIAWYVLFRRLLGAHQLAAALGAGFCGFAPGMISQTNSHLHMTAQWLVPVMVWLIVRMLRAAALPDTAPGPETDPELGTPVVSNGTGRSWRRIVTSAVGLALTVTVQVFVGEEVLFLTALTLIAVTLVYAAANPGLLRRALSGFTAGLLVAVGIALILLGYPLWFQFAGPQSVPNGLFSPFYFFADLASWTAVSPLSVGGDPDAQRLTTGPAEYNTFLGWPLLLVAVACAVWLTKRPLVIACTAAGLVMAALSLGPIVVVNGQQTTTKGPYSLLLGVPVVDGALPMRFALALIPLIATVLVIAVDRALRADRQPVQILVPAAVIAALVPLFPLPLPTADRPALPQFITAGHWRDCVEPGGVLVPVPLPTPKEPWAMRWSTATDVDFGIPEGFFIGPYAAEGKASMGTYKQPTSALLADVAKTGTIPLIGDEQRQQARHDIAFWGASCVALADSEPHAESLRITVEALLGPGTRMADAWAWRVGDR